MGTGHPRKAKPERRGCCLSPSSARWPWPGHHRHPAQSGELLGHQSEAGEQAAAEGLRPRAFQPALEEVGGEGMFGKGLYLKHREGFRENVSHEQGGGTRCVRRRQGLGPSSPSFFLISCSLAFSTLLIILTCVCGHVSNLASPSPPLPRLQLLTLLQTPPSLSACTCSLIPRSLPRFFPHLLPKRPPASSSCASLAGSPSPTAAPSSHSDFSLETYLFFT